MGRPRDKSPVFRYDSNANRQWNTRRREGPHRDEQHVLEYVLCPRYESSGLGLRDHRSLAETETGTPDDWRRPEPGQNLRERSIHPRSLWKGCELRTSSVRRARAAGISTDI